MSGRDWAPNRGIWALVTGALEDLNEHIGGRWEVVEVRAVDHFDQLIEIRGHDGQRRRFRLRLSEMRR